MNFPAARVLPTVIIAISAAAGIVCAACGDWRRVIYWIAAATLNAAVTY